MDIAQAARKHFHLQNTIHWIKSIAIEKDAAGAAAALEKDLAVGHYKPINSIRFLNDCHEFVFHFTPAGRTPLDRRSIGVQYQDASNIGRWRSGGVNRRCRGNAWFIPYDTIKFRDRDRPHPATFPPRLAEYCMRLHGVDRIKCAMDPFLGLGSSAVAAARLDVDFVGVEIDEHYLATGVQRVNEELNQRGLFESATHRRRRARRTIGTVLRKIRLSGTALAALAGARPADRTPLPRLHNLPSLRRRLPATRSRRSPTATRCGSRPRSRARRSCGCCTSTPRRPPRLPGANNHAPSCIQLAPARDRDSNRDRADAS